MKKYFWLFIIATFIFLAHYAFSGQAIYGDGIDYWAYLPSLYFDRDLDFENQYRHIYNPQNNNSYTPEFASEVQKNRITFSGKTDNPHPFGTALIWYPAFILADVLTVFLKLPRTGYSDLYQIFAGLWSIIIVIFGVRINELLALKFTKDKNVSFIAALGIFLASPLLYYGSYDILNSHSASFTATSLFWYFLLFKKFNWKFALFTGGIIGLATLIRLQEAFLLVPTAIYLFWKRRIVNFLIILFIWILIVIPQVGVWLYLYGIPLPETYIFFGQDSRGNFASLWHITNGFFSRTPLLLISLLALAKFLSKFKRVGWLLFSYFLLQFLVISIHGGWSAAAYGGRMYISSLPLFTVLLAYTLRAIKEKWNFRYAKVFIAFFAILNMVSIASFVLFEKEVNSGRKRGLEEHTQQRVERILQKLPI